MGSPRSRPLPSDTVESPARIQPSHERTRDPSCRRAKPLADAFAWQCRERRSGCGHWASGRPARPSAHRLAHQRDRPLQLPLQLLHAEGRVRQELRLPATQCALELRRDHQTGAAVRAARRAQDPADRRRAIAAQEHRCADFTTRGDPMERRHARRCAARPHAHHQRVVAGAQGCCAQGGWPAARDRQPRRARRHRVPPHERRRLSDSRCAGRHRCGGGRRARPHQDQHGREARHQRSGNPADGALLSRSLRRPRGASLYRVHGRRRDKRLAHGRSHAIVGRGRTHRRRVPLGASRREHAGRDRTALGLCRRARRNRRDQQRDSGFLQRLQPRAPVDRRAALSLPLRAQRT